MRSILRAIIQILFFIKLTFFSSLVGNPFSGDVISPGEISFTNVQPNHTAVYQCEASNVHGTILANANIDVVGKHVCILSHLSHVLPFVTLWTVGKHTQEQAIYPLLSSGKWSRSYSQIDWILSTWKHHGGSSLVVRRWDSAPSLPWPPVQFFVKEPRPYRPYSIAKKRKNSCGGRGRAEGIEVPFALHLSIRPHTKLPERYCVGILPNSGMYAVIGEGSGNPLQYSCLENTIDRGARWATVQGVAKNQTQ